MEKVKVLFIDHNAIFMGTGENRQLRKHVKSTLLDYKKRGYLIITLFDTDWLSEGKTTLDHLDVAIKEDLRALGNREQLIDFTNTNIYNSPAKNPDFEMRSLGKTPFYGLVTKAELDLKKRGYLIDYQNSLMVGNSSEFIFCAQGAKVNFEFDKYFFGWTPCQFDDKQVVYTIQFLKKNAEKQIFLRGFIETFGLFFDLNASKLSQSVFSGKVYESYYLPVQNLIQNKYGISSLDTIYEIIIKALLFDFAYEN